MHYHQEGTIWQVSLSHQEVQQIDSAAAISSMVAGAAIPQPLGAAIAAVIHTTAALIRTVDLIGLNNGVNIVGVGLTQFVTVTPHFVSPVPMIHHWVDQLAHSTGLPGGVIGAGLGAGIAWMAAGPSAAVLGGLAGYLGSFFNEGGPRPGDVHSDRVAIGPWEKFVLIALTGGRVAIGSWQGYFCAENNGGGDVHANRSAIQEWENHGLYRNPDGTVSFGHQGYWLCAEHGGGGGSFCVWNRRAVGPWEKFRMEWQPDGTFALRCLEKGTYVSVQG